MSTKIEWAQNPDGTRGETWNPVTGCTRVSEGCDHCYAVKMTHRLAGMGQEKKYGGLTVLNGRGDRHFNGVVRCHEDVLQKTLHWRKPRRIFVNSMSDLFHPEVPFDFIDRVFAVMALCPQHTFQVLTKRPERMAEYLNTGFVANRVFEQMRALTPQSGVWGWPTWSNAMSGVWLGTSVENQQAADERIPHLLECPAAVRFLSCEPLLGPIDLDAYFGGPYVGIPGDVVHDNYNFGVDWVIVGGESGPGARPCNIDWIRSIIVECWESHVPCFVKQLGSRPYDPSWHGDGTPHGSRMLLDHPKGGDPEEWPEDLRVREFPTAMEAVL